MSSLVLLFILSLSLAQDLYDDQSNIIHLTQDNFDSLVTKTDDLWLIEFYAPWCGHCQGFASDYKKVASYLRGIVKVGGVDMTKHEAIGSRYKIDGFPTFLFFAARGANPIKFSGTRSIDGLLSFVFEQTTELVNKRQSEIAGSHQKKSSSESQDQNANTDDSDVVVLTDDNFEATVNTTSELWLIEFYAPWCGHCKNLAPHWNTAATSLKGRVKFGKVDATVQNRLATKYKINAYPTVKVFLPGHDLDSPLDYENGEGLRSAAALEASALEYLQKYPPNKEILQLTNMDLLQKECTEKNGICIIGFLPHLVDSKAEGRKEYIKKMADAAKKNSQYPIYYFWTQAYDQKALERMFNLGSGYPTVVAFSYSKKKYSIMRGAYTTETISEFIGDLMRGFETLYEFNELPKLANVNKWDGNDYKEDL